MIFLNGRGKKMSKWPRRRNWGFGSGSTVRRIPVAGTVEGQQKHLHERWDTSAPAIEARTEQKRQPRSLDVSMEKKQSAIRSKAVVQVRVTRYQKLLGNAKSWKAAVLSHGKHKGINTGKLSRRKVWQDGSANMERAVSSVQVILPNLFGFPSMGL